MKDYPRDIFQIYSIPVRIALSGTYAGSVPTFS